METLDELELEGYKKMALGYTGRLASSFNDGEYELYGEPVDNFQSRLRKLRDLLSEPKQDPATTHIK